MKFNIENLKSEIEKLVKPVYRAEEVELVELIVRYERGGLVLRFLSDTSGGISIDKCARLNRAIGALLEEKELIESKYYIEVSSPGLDRQLKTERDFERVIGKIVKIKTSDGEKIKGEVLKTEDDKVLLEAGEDEPVIVELANIKKAKLVITF